MKGEIKVLPLACSRLRDGRVRVRKREDENKTGGSDIFACLLLTRHAHYLSAWNRLSYHGLLHFPKSNKNEFILVVSFFFFFTFNRKFKGSLESKTVNVVPLSLLLITRTIIVHLNISYYSLSIMMFHH